MKRELKAGELIELVDKLDGSHKANPYEKGTESG